ncbi:uncharacterized protein LOC127806722 [Diospyros lotus]|uniref:uncharacterized protein LOC127806722 n=1 Tax=Diospyros lotus TaxID=55363 RepID=UPI0022597DE4|nr:uncharacterized protein LOC127806722 [Diospyros lotus]XP_052200147.1 uncharacterized protein LOC127806722 [Diospyros lotus]
MSVLSSHPGSTEAPMFFTSDSGKSDRGAPGAETWQKCHKRDENLQDGREEIVPVMERKRSLGDLGSLNLASSSSQLSTISTMSESSAPTFVYRRRKLQKNSASVSPAQALAKTSDGCLYVINSEAPSEAIKVDHIVSAVELESEVDHVGAPIIPPVECATQALASKEESMNGCLDREEPFPEGALKSDNRHALELCCVNDSYSSSKSNVELGSASLRTEVDDTGECSSSSALIVEGVQDDMSERDVCISILRSQGLLGRVRPIMNHKYAEGPGTSNDGSYMWACNVCHHLETVLKMLICDRCEEAFHVSCCNPRLKKIPVDEWFCHSCAKKKHKILKEKTMDISCEMSRSRNATSKGELGPIASILRDTGPYTSRVRIGQYFQAEVPDWSGPSVDEIDTNDDALVIYTSECVSLHGWDSRKPSKLSSIGNWLQCREVIQGIGEGIDGNICGKWRRAPLFEVQTDDWECFNAILWDPAHADCAVPQELETDQVLKHLKYIEMLRPRLTARRCKLGRSKNASSQDVTKG